MGMGYSAAYADVVSEDFVKEMCPDEYNKFMEQFDDKTVVDNVVFTIEYFAQNLGYSDDYNQSYEDLIKKFEERTGLTLWIGYHDIENDGDRYDDIDGVYWSVGGVYQHTPAGEKYKHRIQRAFFVNFG